MRIRTTTAGIAVALITLTGCGTDRGSEGTPTAAPSTTTSSSGNSDMTANGAPKVKNPLDYAKHEANPCGVLTPAQLQTLGLSGVTGKDDSTPAGKACIWHGRDTPSAQTPGIVFVTGGGGLDFLFKTRKNFKLFEPQPDIQGYPTILNSPADLRSRGDCALAVGITDTQIVTVTIQLAQKAPKYADPCGAATEFANQVITTIKGGA